MRVGQVSNIKHQFEVSGISVSMAKTQHLNAHWPTLAIRAEPIKQETAQCMNSVIRGIDDLVRHGANTGHRRPFRTYGLQQTLALLCRMGSPSFAKATLQNLVGSFKKQNVNN